MFPEVAIGTTFFWYFGTDWKREQRVNAGAETVELSLSLPSNEFQCVSKPILRNFTSGSITCGPRIHFLSRSLFDFSLNRENFCIPLGPTSSNFERGNIQEQVSGTGVEHEWNTAGTRVILLFGTWKHAQIFLHYRPNVAKESGKVRSPFKAFWVIVSWVLLFYPQSSA